MDKGVVSRDEEILARKIAAACIAHFSGLNSIDYALKTRVLPSETIGPKWIDLARRAQEIKQQVIGPLRMRATEHERALLRNSTNPIE